MPPDVDQDEALEIAGNWLAATVKGTRDAVIVVPVQQSVAHSEVLGRLTSRYTHGRPRGRSVGLPRASSWRSGLIGGCSRTYRAAIRARSWGPNLIVSTSNVVPGGATLAHELGHTEQAQLLGDRYLPGYVSFFELNWSAHPMEQDANRRAGLVGWNGGSAPDGWTFPFSGVTYSDGP